MPRFKLKIKKVYLFKSFPKRVIWTHTGQGICTASKDTAPRLAINDKPCEVQEWACLTWGMLLEDSHMALPSQKWSSLRCRAVTPSKQASSPSWKCLSFKGFAITQKHRKEIREKETVSKRDSSTDRIVCFWKPSLNTYPFHYLTCAWKHLPVRYFIHSRPRNYWAPGEASARRWGDQNEAVFATFQERTSSHVLLATVCLDALAPRPQDPAGRAGNCGLHHNVCGSPLALISEASVFRIKGFELC